MTNERLKDAKSTIEDIARRSGSQFFNRGDLSIVFDRTRDVLNYSFGIPKEILKKSYNLTDLAEALLNYSQEKTPIEEDVDSEINYYTGLI